MNHRAQILNITRGENLLITEALPCRRGSPELHRVRSPRMRIDKHPNCIIIRRLIIIFPPMRKLHLHMFLLIKLRINQSLGILRQPINPTRPFTLRQLFSKKINFMPIQRRIIIARPRHNPALRFLIPRIPLLKLVLHHLHRKEKLINPLLSNWRASEPGRTARIHQSTTNRIPHPLRNRLIHMNPIPLT